MQKLNVLIGTNTLEQNIFKIIKESLYGRIAPAIVIVPSQASFLVESQIITRCGVDGFINAEVLSFEKLTERVLHDTGGRTLTRIDSIGNTMLIKSAIMELKGKLKLLGNSDDPKFIYNLISALKIEDFSYEEILELSKKVSSPLSEKLADIALVYQATILPSKVLDSNSAEELAISQIVTTKFLSEKTVIIHGFDSLPRRRVRAVIELIKCSNSVTLTADPRFNMHWLDSLNDIVGKLGAKVTRTVIPDDTHGELSFLSRALYSSVKESYEAEPSNLRIICAQSKRSEVEYAASRVLELICEHGFSANDIALLSANTSDYDVANVFSRSGIPIFVDGKRPLCENRLCAFVLSLLDILSHGRIDDFVRHIKSGLLISNSESDLLTCYIQENGLKNFSYPFIKAPENIEALRAQIFEKISNIAQCSKSESICALLLEYIEPTREQLHTDAISLMEIGLGAESRYVEQIYEHVLDIIQQADILLKDKSQLRDVLDSGFESTLISVVPPMSEQVVFGDVTHSILPLKKVLIVLGVSDSVIPSISKGGLLTEYDIEMLRESCPRFPGKQSFDDQKATISRTFLGGEQLELCYSGTPSHIIHRTKRLFPKLNENKAEEFHIRSEALCLNKAARELRAIADGQSVQGNVLSACMAISSTRLYSLLPQLYEKNIPSRIENPKSLLRGGVNMIENYYKCAYRHFVQYGIQPVEVKKYEEDALNAGLYVHSLLDGLNKKLSSSNYDWKTVTSDIVLNMLQEISKVVAPIHNRGIFSRNKRFAFTEQRLRENAANAALAVIQQLEGHTIRDTEFRFGNSALFRIGNIELTGVIDRIDMTEDESSVRIVDYKSSEKKFDICEVYYGVSLQLIVYLMAASTLYNALPQGAFYFHVHTPYIKEGENRLKCFRMRGFITDTCAEPSAISPITMTREELKYWMDHVRKKIEEASISITNGELSLQPFTWNKKSECEHCPYHSICRFDQAFGNTYLCPTKEVKTPT